MKASVMGAVFVRALSLAAAITLLASPALAQLPKLNLLQDNKVTEGMLWVVIIAGIAGVMWFMSGIVTRVVYGPPPPPPEN